MEANSLLIPFIVVLAIIIVALLLALLTEGFSGHIQLRKGRRASQYDLTPHTAGNLPNATSTRIRLLRSRLMISIRRIGGKEHHAKSVDSTQEISYASKRAEPEATSRAILQKPPNEAITTRAEVIQDGNTTASADNTIITRAVSFLDLNRKQRASLRKQARIDYEQARGSSHQRILAEARKRIERRKKELEQRVDDLQRQLDELNVAYQAELKRELELHIINTRFQEVEGIGSSLRTRIFNTLHPTCFADLHYASTVPGVGEGRMTAIMSWINNYNQQMCQLLAKPFPGSDVIERRYSDRKSTLQVGREQTQKALVNTRQQITEIDHQLSWLKVISPNTYIDAARGNVNAQAQIERHIIGVFPEWKPIPTWFKEIIDGKDIA